MARDFFCLVLSECARQFYKVTNKDFNFVKLQNESLLY